MRILKSLAVAATAILLPLATAQVADAASPTKPGAKLELSYTSSGGYTAHVHLTCSPTGGTHSNPWQACWALKDADGDFDAIKPWDWMECTQEYKPVAVKAKGHWWERKISFYRVYPNACEAEKQTAGVFDF